MNAWREGVLALASLMNRDVRSNWLELIGETDLALEQVGSDEGGRARHRLGRGEMPGPMTDPGQMTDSGQGWTRRAADVRAGPRPLVVDIATEA